MYTLHAVIIDKSISLPAAKKISNDIIKKDVSFYRTTNSSYRFRAVPKTKFKKDSFRSKKINDNVTLIFGDLL